MADGERRPCPGGDLLASARCSAGYADREEKLGAESATALACPSVQADWLDSVRPVRRCRGLETTTGRQTLSPSLVAEITRA